MDTPPITFLGKEWRTALPDFATREELMDALRETSGDTSLAIFRLCAAVVALCTTFGAENRLDYIKAKCNPYAYGAAAYTRLREQGVTRAEIADLASPLIVVLRNAVFPRAAEVEAVTDFSSPAEAGQTEKLSTSP